MPTTIDLEFGVDGNMGVGKGDNEGINEVQWSCWVSLLEKLLSWIENWGVVAAEKGRDVVAPTEWEVEKGTTNGKEVEDEIKRLVC